MSIRTNRSCLPKGDKTLPSADGWSFVVFQEDYNKKKENFMRVLLQRVTRASVTVDGKTVGAIGHGYLALVGIGSEDT